MRRVRPRRSRLAVVQRVRPASSPGAAAPSCALGGAGATGSETEAPCGMPISSFAGRRWRRGPATGGQGRLFYITSRDEIRGSTLSLRVLPAAAPRTPRAGPAGALLPAIASPASLRGSASCGAFVAPAWRRGRGVGRARSTARSALRARGGARRCRGRSLRLARRCGGACACGHLRGSARAPARCGGGLARSRRRATWAVTLGHRRHGAPSKWVASGREAAAGRCPCRPAG